MTRGGTRPACHAWAVAIEVVAHRGANEDEPEHSLAAYMRALDEGADAVECDVRLTADGALVLVHDRRIDRTSSGRGKVSAHRLADLSQHDYSGPTARWHDFEGPKLDESRTRVLTLDALLGALLERSDSVKFAIETKHPTRYGGYVEEVLVETLERFGLARPPRDGTSRVRMMSFSQSAVRRMRALAPGIPTVLLMDPVPMRLRDGSLPLGIPIAGPSIDVIRAHPRYPSRVHDHGGLVHVWTVDDVADVDLCVQAGVDAIITNRPAMVLARLRKGAHRVEGHG
jgi:glycerophosphoryl diester phosphodiesterase